MASPVICLSDSSIGNGQLMIKDMWPNRSHANPVVDPAPQGPRYLRVVETATPVVANNAVVKTVSGLSAYLLVTVDAGAGNANPSPAQADAMADALITEMRAGNALTLADINTALDAVVGGTGIVGTGNSTATVNNILQILSGAPFTVPTGVSVNATFQVEQGQANLFTSSFNPIIEEDSSFWISLAQGDILGAKNAGFVVVYDGDGNVI